MSIPSFDRYGAKLCRNVYGTLKGRIRLELLLADIAEYCPEFSSKTLKILDAGGGAGQFAGLCLERGHEVVYLDSSQTMLERAADNLGNYGENGGLTLIQHDFLEEHDLLRAPFDLVLMHGSAEWMADTPAAIVKACRLCRGGYLSLLLFNRDKQLLKQGINGHLLTGSPSQKKKLIPPGAATVRETAELLATLGVEILVQSGIRIFYNFFRQIEDNSLPPDEWLEQERRWYRTPPFSMLGEHSHFLCRIGS